MTAPWPAPTPTQTDSPLARTPLARWWHRTSLFNKLAFIAAAGYAAFLVAGWNHLI